MLRPKIYYKGNLEFPHFCDAGWRNHTSTVVVEQISPRMGIIIQSDGGGPYTGSKRQSYWVDRAASEEVGKKVQLSRLIYDVDQAAKNFEMLDKEFKSRNRKVENAKVIMHQISQHPAFAGFKDAV